MKKININKTIHELVTLYPEIKEIMFSLGFEHIMIPLMLKTAGKVMSLKAGARMKNIDWQLIKAKFSEHDFILEEKDE